MLLLFPKQSSQRRVLLGPIHSFHIIIITAPGYPKECAHDGYRICVLMTINYLILDLRPHFLPMSAIKSRSSTFSIFRRLFSYLYSCKVLAGFRPLWLGMTCTAFFRSRFSNAWIGLSPSSPSLSVTSPLAHPAFQHPLDFWQKLLHFLIPSCHIESPLM